MKIYGNSLELFCVSNRMSEKFRYEKTFFVAFLKEIDMTAVRQDH